MYRRYSLTLLAIFTFVSVKLYLYSPIELEKNENDNIDLLRIFLEDHNYTSKKILANGAHIIKYYLESDQVDNLSSLNQNKPEFYQRQNYKYVNIEEVLRQRFYEIIIISSNSDFNELSFKKLINFGYKEYKIDGFNVYINQSTLN